MLADARRILLEHAEKAPEGHPEPPGPAAFEAELPETDADEAVEPGGREIAEAISEAVGITYVDAKGKASRRRVLIRSLRETDNGHHFAYAYCYERQALRAFRLDRIGDVFDLHTGEALGDGSVLLRAFEADDPTSQALAQCRPGLQVMAFLGWVDGLLDQNERDVMVRYVADHCDGVFDEQRVRRAIAAMHPDVDAFHDGLDRLLTAAPGAARHLLRTLHRLASADDHVSADEFAYLLEAEQELTG